MKNKKNRMLVSPPKNFRVALLIKINEATSHMTFVVRTICPSVKLICCNSGREETMDCSRSNVGLNTYFRDFY